MESECFPQLFGLRINQTDQRLPEQFLLIASSSFFQQVTAALHAGKIVLALMKIILWPAVLTWGGVSALSPTSIQSRQPVERTNPSCRDSMGISDQSVTKAFYCLCSTKPNKSQK